MTVPGIGSVRLPTGLCSSGYNGTCPHLTAAITSSSPTLCRAGTAHCPGGAPSNAQVTLWVNGTGHELTTSSYIQVVFVVETTLFDGVYDPMAGEAGTGWCSGPCEESNGVPFFVANAGTIATDIASEYNAGQSSCVPSTQRAVCFAMVDYFSTAGADHDDGDGSEYHPDVTTFTPAGSFQTAVQGSFQNTVLSGGWIYSDSDFSDNILSSSSITALYGAQRGTGLAWDPTADHVIVWIGSTVPREYGYLTDYSATYQNFANGLSSPCEPSYFTGQPSCYGWVNATNSVASFAQANHMAIDVVDLANGMSNASSGDYRHGSVAQADADSILRAGCDLASATGGSWEGPFGNSTCSAAVTGTGHGNLTCVAGASCEAVGAEANPARVWSSNPSLGWALTHFNLPTGGITSNISAWGTDHDTFEFLPAAGLAVNASNPQYQVACSRAVSNPPLPQPCSPTPLVQGLGPLGTGVGWAWPDSVMYLNDTWKVSFLLEANASFPDWELGQAGTLDACQNQSWWGGCRPFSGGVYSKLSYNLSSGAPINPAPSFPPAWITVVGETPLRASATASPTSGAAQLTVQFTGAASGGTSPYVFHWTFGDGSSGSLAQDPVHAYNFTGTFPVQLTVTDAFGQTANAFLNTSVLSGPPPLTATVRANPSTGSLPLTVIFTSLVSGGIPPYVWGWNFGDGSTGTGENITHTFQSVGTFTVVLTVVDSGTSSVVRTVNVTVTPVSAPLLVRASASPNSGASPLTVVFNGTATGGLPSYHFYWDYGDGSLGSAAENPTHVFNGSGTYPVRLVVTDQLGQQATASLNVTVGGGSLALTATASPVSGPVGAVVQFQAVPTGGQSPYAVTWSFDDGSGPASGLSPTHSFAYAGTFLVHAWVNDSEVPSRSASATTTVTVYPAGPVPLSVTLSALPNPVYVGSPLTFQAGPAGGVPPYAYTWRGLPPGCTGGSSQWLPCTPTSAGHFNVSVTVTDRNASTASATVEVGVLAPPGTGHGTSSVGPLGAHPWETVTMLLVGAVVAAVLLIFLYTRRRKRRGSEDSHADPGPAPVAEAPPLD